MIEEPGRGENTTVWVAQIWCETGGMRKLHISVQNWARAHMLQSTDKVEQIVPREHRRDFY